MAGKQILELLRKMDSGYSPTQDERDTLMGVEGLDFTGTDLTADVLKYMEESP